jgi:ATP-binding protein involved in chromosome partitioning
VGKSTLASNLAVALAQNGFSTGLMDADIYGPSLPTMMSVNGRPLSSKERKILPLRNHGVACMSIGLLVEDSEPIIWRGPMVMGVVRQFLQDVAWGELDFLVVDLPPGTGDAQLTMIQAVPISGAVIITTPQEVALTDARRGIEMFRKLDVPVLGIVENMSWLEVPGGRIHPFGSGGGNRTAQRFEVPLLVEIPLDPDVGIACENGQPVALSAEGPGAFYHQVAAHVSETLLGSFSVG